MMSPELLERLIITTLQRVEANLDVLIKTLLKVETQNMATTAALDALTKQVQATVGVEQSTITLLQGIVPALQASNDPAMVTLAGQLQNSMNELAAAVAAVPAPSTPPA